jgi:hypothetical protein
MNEIRINKTIMLDQRCQDFYPMQAGTCFSEVLPPAHLAEHGPVDRTHPQY